MWVTHIAAPAEDGTDTVFRNVGFYYSDAGEIPRRQFIINIEKDFQEIG